jgi:hypothetical protein
MIVCSAAAVGVSATNTFNMYPNSGCAGTASFSSSFTDGVCFNTSMTESVQVSCGLTLSAVGIWNDPVCGGDVAYSNSTYLTACAQLGDSISVIVSCDTFPSDLTSSSTGTVSAPSSSADNATGNDATATVAASAVLIAALAMAARA